MTLNPSQFSIYRGLYLGGNAPDPEDHEGIMARVEKSDDYYVQQHRLPGTPGDTRPDRPVYGRNWTPHEHTAKKFAFDPSHGRLVHPRYNRESPTLGVVLEAQSQKPAEVDRLREYETHARFPNRQDITSLQAHVHVYDPSKRFPMRESRVGSFEIPRERWEQR